MSVINDSNYDANFIGVRFCILESNFVNGMEDSEKIYRNMGYRIKEASIDIKNVAKTIDKTLKGFCFVEDQITKDEPNNFNLVLVLKEEKGLMNVNIKDNNFIFMIVFKKES